MGYLITAVVWGCPFAGLPLLWMKGAHKKTILIIVSVQIVAVLLGSSLMLECMLVEDCELAGHSDCYARPFPMMFVTPLCYLVWVVMFSILWGDKPRPTAG